MIRILVVDDDAHIRQLVKHILTSAGFEVIEASDGAMALAMLDDHKVVLAVLDIMMPRMDGWELCRRIRQSWDFPLIMLSAKGQTVDKVKGLEIGCDDYMVKPFDRSELLARVRALLRRAGIESAQRRKLGEIVLDEGKFELIVDNEQVIIPKKEFELLFKFASYPGRTFTRDQLLEDLWGYDFDGTERTVDVHINRLRERFPEGRFGFVINTIRGLGYRLEVINEE